MCRPYRDGRSESRSLVPSARPAHSGQVPEQVALSSARLCRAEVNFSVVDRHLWERNGQ